MAHTKNASYASQINTIYEKIAANKDLNELSKRLVKENVEIKYQKYADKENVKLKVLELALADLQEEINKSSFVNVTYFDSETGEDVTIEAKPSDISYQTGYDWVRGQVIWKSVTVFFEEK